jgi:hypothetical protein
MNIDIDIICQCLLNTVKKKAKYLRSEKRKKQVFFMNVKSSQFYFSKLYINK